MEEPASTAGHHAGGTATVYDELRTGHVPRVVPVSLRPAKRRVWSGGCFYVSYTGVMSRQVSRMPNGRICTMTFGTPELMTADFSLIYAAQAKAQVLNTYSGFLVLSNLFDAVFRRNPSRFAMVVLGNVIGLLIVGAGVLGILEAYLGLLGILTTSLCSIIISDYYLVGRQFAADLQEAAEMGVESINWAGSTAWCSPPPPSASRCNNPASLPSGLC